MLSTVPFGQPDHDRRDAGDVHQVRLQHAERDARGAAGIDRVAAGLQDGERRPTAAR